MNEEEHLLGLIAQTQSENLKLNITYYNTTKTIEKGTLNKHAKKISSLETELKQLYAKDYNNGLLPIELIWLIDEVELLKTNYRMISLEMSNLTNNDDNDLLDDPCMPPVYGLKRRTCFGHGQRNNED